MEIITVELCNGIAAALFIFIVTPKEILLPTAGTMEITELELTLTSFGYIIDGDLFYNHSRI